MSELKKCRACGVDIQSNAPFGHCPKCLLELGLGVVPAVESDNDSASDEPDVDTVKLAPATEAPGDYIDRYKLLQKIGEGGCGVVYMAEQQEPIRRRVALKVIKPGMDTREVIARFETERQALALMDHPNIAKVLDVGQTDTGRPFFVMELVKGVRITDYCDQNNLPTHERLVLFTQVCQAVQHAHQKGIIHRDIKPSNILVTLHDGVRVPKVIDFGIAKAINQQRLTDITLFTAFGQFIGTPAYMSPEQAEMSGLDIDTRSDIYSLGVLLYELLVGRVPFDGQQLLQAGLDEMRRMIREQEPPKPSTRLSTMTSIDLTTVAKHRQSEPARLIHMVRGDLDWIVMKCLEKDRTGRYETANGLAADIQRHLDNEAISACPPSAVYRLQKFVRRNQGLVAATASIVLMLFLGVVVSTWQWRRAKVAGDGEIKQRKDAQTARHEAESVVNQMRLQRVDEFLAADQLASGIAHLARVVREEPTNRIATERLVALLSQRTFAIPRKQFVTQSEECSQVEFSPDGQRLVTGTKVAAAKRPRARFYDVRTGQAIGRHMEHEDDIVYGGQILSLTFSPDGRKVVTTSGDGTARIWDSDSGEPAAPPLRHAMPVKAVQFSPDGKKLVTVSEDKTVMVWDTQTGKPLTGPIKHGDWAISSARFSPDGQRIVTASQDTTAVLWDANTGQKLVPAMKHEKGGFYGGIFYADFSPDGRKIVTASADKTARIWDSLTGQPLTVPLAHEDLVLWASFSPSGLRVVTRSGGKAYLWDSQTGKPIGKPMSGIDQLKFSPDGQKLLSLGGGRARVWDAWTGEALVESFLGGGILAVAWHPDSQQVATTSTGGALQIWDVRGSKLSGRPFHTGSSFIALSSAEAGGRLATIDSDGNARVWDTATGELTALVPRQQDPFVQVELSPDAKRLLTRSTNGVQVWDCVNSQLLCGPLHRGSPLNVAHFAPDGIRVVTAGDDKTAKVWETTGGKLVSGPMRHNDAVYSAEFTRDGKRLMTVTFDAKVQVWSASDGKPETTSVDLLEGGAVISVHGRSPPNVALSPDGRFAAMTEFGAKAVKVWRLSNGRLLSARLQHETQITSFTFNPDSSRVATSSLGGVTRIWDFESGLLLAETPRHGQWLWNVQFSSDGRRVLTRTEDEGARIWEAEKGQPLTEVFHWYGKTKSAVLSADGQLVAAVGDDGRAWVWDVPMAPIPVPSWIGEFAEALGGMRLNGQNFFEVVPSRTLFEFVESLAKERKNDDYTRWAKWLLTDATEKTVSPRSTLALSNRLHLRIVKRNADSTRTQVDLSDYYNEELQIHDDSKAFPMGRTNLSGVEFDIRAGIQLRGRQLDASRPGLPQRLTGIQIRQKCQQLHFLHAATWASPQSTQLGSYIMHFSDGRRHELPIIYGVNTSSWWQDGPGALTDATVAWAGRTAQRIPVYLFKATWQNPFLDTEIISIDFTSCVADSGPFLVAITAE